MRLRQNKTAASACQKEINLSGYLPALDGIRGLAILGVMLTHWFSFSIRWGGPTAWRLFNTSLLSKAAYKPLEFGAHGVDLFFVLSGFLITGILWDSKGKESYFKNFYARRVLRIFPLYYGTLIVVFFLVPLLRWAWAGVVPRFPEFQLYYWCYLGNLNFSWPQPTGSTQFVGAIPGNGAWFALGHFWSLAVEEQFYLV